MFDLSRKEQRQARASKPVQPIKDMAANLGMNELVEPTNLVDIHNAIWETFGDWARKSNPIGDGEKFYAYDAMQITQEFSRAWSRLHNIVARSRNKELRTTTNLCAWLA